MNKSACKAKFSYTKFEKIIDKDYFVMDAIHGGGGSLHSQVEHHMQDKFATPVLHGIDNFKFYDNFSTYT